jgi:hypothetical protein
VESYEIDGFWTKDPDSSVRIATLHGADMADTLPEGATPNRETPLWRPHPVDFTLTTELLLHETWPIDDETTTIEHPAFRFDRSVEGRDQGRHIVIVDRYRSLADHVLPADLPDYLAKRKEAENSLGFELTWNPDGVTGGGFNFTLAVLLTVLLVGFARLALRVYRHDPPGPSAPLDPALQGIRGWLILPAIGVALTPLVLLVEAAANLGPYSSSQWSALTTPGGDSYHALWAPILLGELVFGVAMLVLSVLLLVMFFQRRRRAPLLYILMLAGSALGLAASVAALELMPVGELQASAQDWRDLGRALFSCLIWIPYMLRSRRVKSTFIRTYRQAPDALPTAPPLPAG